MLISKDAKVITDKDGYDGKYFRMDKKGFRRVNSAKSFLIF
jgi:hypothetical protein